jgi:hypothetical protein
MPGSPAFMQTNCTRWKEIHLFTCTLWVVEKDTSLPSGVHTADGGKGNTLIAHTQLLLLNLLHPT